MNAEQHSQERFTTKKLARPFAFRTMPQWFSRLLFILLLPQILHGQGASYNAAFTRNPVPLGEPTVLQLRYINCEPEQVPEIPKINELTITYIGPSRNSNLRIVNGRQTINTSTIHQYNVAAEKTGIYTIPPIESRINGKAYTTQAIRLNVSKGIDYSQYAFLQIHIPKQEAEQRFYLGEVFQIHVHLYALNAKIEEKPTIASDGFVIAESGQPSQRQVQDNNQIYNRITFTYLARAVKTGELAIGPIDWKVALFFRDNSNRRRDLFDSFFSDSIFNNNTVRRNITLTSEPIPLNILPLPDEGRPDSFNGGIGNFTMDVQASPTVVVAGDPVTITMKIQGQGALEALPMPAFDSWREFQQYPETADIHYSDEIGLSGIKTFEKIVIPGNAEIQNLPQIEFSFFDPQAEQYKILQQGPIPLTVQPNLTTSQPAFAAEVGTAGKTPNIATNIVHIKPRLGAVAAASQPWLRQPWFLGLQAVPIAIWIACRLYLARQNALRRNPRALRRKRVKVLVDDGLQTLKNLAAENCSGEFFAVLFRLLQEQIGERLNLPANAITEAAIEIELCNRGLDPEIRNTLDRLFQMCNQSRYAPIDSSAELTQIATDAQCALRELQNLPEPDTR